jgi:hypothetical protein
MVVSKSMKKEFKGNTAPKQGKGSKRRPENFKKFQSNWNEIKGLRKS